MSDGKRVLLLRDVPEQRLLSMERLADEVERGFVEHDRYDVERFAVRQSALLSRTPAARLDGYAARFVRYPLSVRRKHADVYHIIDHGYAHLGAVLPPDRTVISGHDVMLLRAAEGHGGFTPGRVPLQRLRWSMRFLRRAARVIVPTNATKEDVVRFADVDPSRVSVVPYGVDARFAPIPDEQRRHIRGGLRSAQHVIMHVSTGDPYKNVEGTLAVLAAVLESGLDVMLMRTGRKLSDGQRALARRLRLEERIIDCGRVSDARLVELYNAADVLLFPSYWEGYGWPPLEAMACGTPVVASDIAPLREVLGTAALLANPHDAAALACDVCDVLTRDDLRTALRLRGLDRAGQYTWTRTVEGFARTYDAVTGPSAREELACAA
jgi:glycosyltransferase involved in cell wall biosynthesis